MRTSDVARLFLGTDLIQGKWPCLPTSSVAPALWKLPLDPQHFSSIRRTAAVFRPFFFDRVHVSRRSGQLFGRADRCSHSTMHDAQLLLPYAHRLLPSGLRRHRFSLPRLFHDGFSSRIIWKTLSNIEGVDLVGLARWTSHRHSNAFLCFSRIFCLFLKFCFNKIMFKSKQNWLLQAKVVHENVPGFNILLLAVNLVSLYWIYPIEADSADSGMHAMSRRRSYCILFNRRKTAVIANPVCLYMLLSRAITQHCSVWRPTDLFWATQEQVLQDVSALATQRGVPLNNVTVSLRPLLTLDEEIRLQRFEQFPEKHYGKHSTVVRFVQ